MKRKKLSFNLESFLIDEILSKIVDIDDNKEDNDDEIDIEEIDDSDEE